MLNKRKLKYNFGTECILLKTVYNREYIYVITKGEIYIWLNSVSSFWKNDTFSWNSADWKGDGFDLKKNQWSQMWV